MGNRMSFDITMTRETAVALLAWDEKLYDAYRARRMLNDSVNALCSIGLLRCAEKARKARRLFEEDFATGAVVNEMLERHIAEHPCLTEAVTSELLRQYTNIRTRELFVEVDDDSEVELQRQKRLGEVADFYIDAARRALAEGEQA